LFAAGDHSSRSVSSSSTDLLGYHNNKKQFFKPTESSTFKLVKLGNVNVTFLDKTNLLGYDGQDMAKLGKYSVETRLGMITHCNSANFNDVDGIIGFGWANQNRSAAILKTLTQDARPHWDITQRTEFTPMPRKFAFTASEEVGELQLGGYEAESISEPMQLFPMAGYAYGVNVTSIKFGNTELLNFVGDANDAYVGEFDSGTTCLLIPNGTVNNTFDKSPFEILLDEQNKGGSFPLVYTIGGREYSIAYEECVEPADRAMILGDPWFRKFIVLHDLVDLNDKKMGLALRNPKYQLGVETYHDDSATLRPSIALGKMQLLAELSNKQVDKIRAHRRVRSSELAMTKVTYGGETVDKVALSSQSRVTYNIKLSIGSPPQPLQVIFDTGSFMLAVFADKAPKGMKPILEAEATVFEGARPWGGVAGELMWRLQGLDRTVLVAANLLFVGLIAATVTSLAKKRAASQDRYQELEDMHADC